MTSNITTEPRVATASDIPQLVNVINRAYIAEAQFVHGVRTDRVDLHERIAAPNTWLLVIDANASDPSTTTIIGCVSLNCDGTRGHIGLLSVDPDFQGRGLGALLLRAAESLCKTKMGCANIELAVVNLRDDLFPFYERMGYQRTDTAPFPDESRLKQPAHLVVMRRMK